MIFSFDIFIYVILQTFAACKLKIEVCTNHVKVSKIIANLKNSYFVFFNNVYDMIRKSLIFKDEKRS